MTLLANALLALAALLTALVALLVAEARHVGGADAMGLVVVPMLLGPRWLALASATGIAARRAALDWIHPSPAVQATVAIPWLALAGLASFSSVIVAHGPHSAAFKPLAFALAVVVPAAVTAGAAIALNGAPSARSSPATWRLAAGALSLAVGAGALAMGRVEWSDARETRAAQVAADEARQAWLAEQHRTLQALSPQAPLREWLPWLNVSPVELQQRALDVVRARPTLEQDVAEMLRGDEAPLALRFMWLWMPDSPASLAEPARAAIARLPGWAEGYLSQPPTPPDTADPDHLRDEFPPRHPVDLSDMAQAAIVIADRYRASGLDFVTPVRAFADVLARHALPEERLGEDVTYQPRAYLDTWLRDRHTAGQVDPVRPGQAPLP